MFQPHISNKTGSEQPSWESELRSSYRSLESLLTAGLISELEFTKARSWEATSSFEIRVTPYYTSLFENSPDCPIRRQALPQLMENDPALPDWAVQKSLQVYGRKNPWHADAIGDIENLKAPRLTHRYTNRAILHLSSTCAVYCRFCFRKSHLNAKEDLLYQGNLDPAFEYLKSHREIRELILTGGDPLSVSDSLLEKVFDRVANETQIQVVRIHTRMPVTLPSRLTPKVLEVLSSKNQARHFGQPSKRKLSTVIVTHFNHPREITPMAVEKLQACARSEIRVFNQSVLLKGVNDSSECLSELFQTLYENNVTPYYLHHPDWTPGTFGFRISIEEGQKIYRSLRGLISGPALPQYVLDLPQGHGKVSLTDSGAQLLEHFGDQEIKGAVYRFRTPVTESHPEGSPLEVDYLDLAWAPKSI